MSCAQKNIRDSDSSADSAAGSVSFTAEAARRIHGQPRQSASTSSSCSSRTRPECRAASMATTPSRSDSARVRSTKVLATVVTGKPFTSLTCQGGSPAR
jgi:hypothetical protein